MSVFGPVVPKFSILSDFMAVVQKLNDEKIFLPGFDTIQLPKIGI